MFRSCTAAATASSAASTSARSATGNTLAGGRSICRAIGSSNFAVRLLLVTLSSTSGQLHIPPAPLTKPPPPPPLVPPPLLTLPRLPKPKPTPKPKAIPNTPGTCLTMAAAAGEALVIGRSAAPPP
ncbi:hypothetical protein Vretimale_14320 [Volvox reticuliferus]|uniref:Uncharacterized protein n=1 Tax=Volvox reticuliferus TaxID=1737510 RepID=A0A8J4GPE3_9CHLO|nr:hypothetical protein Vretimale_14320 [Volvox reticuliferus]